MRLCLQVVSSNPSALLTVKLMTAGIVGSDPYLAPEVYDERKYDPQPTDIWSLAIIFCCMSLRRFPWKMPRMTDNSYKLFASPPSPGTDMRRSTDNSKSTNDLAVTPARDAQPSSQPSSRNPSPSRAPSVPAGVTGAQRGHNHTASTGTTASSPEKKPEVIKGPWRLLRLLPRESRHILGRMLEINPRQRATMSEILEDPWVANTPICRQIEQGQVIKAEGHVHTLEPPAAPAK
jgi:serine/threonine protein kinase